jgi:hypothetical protein
LQLKAYYIVGSLVGTILNLQITLVVKRAPPVAPLLAIVAMVVWSTSMIWLIPNTSHSHDGKDKGKDSITSTYLLFGAKIGLITGFSQLVLCIPLYSWMDTAAGAMLLLLVLLGVTAAGWAGMHLIHQDDCEVKERMKFGYYTPWICMGIFWIGADFDCNKGENIPIFLLLSTLSLVGVYLAVVPLPKEATLEERAEASV